MFAPTLSEKLTLLKQAEDPLNKEAFQARVDLFLAEKEFPPAFLGQVLRYQEKERTTGLYDPRLMRENPSLFGYRNLNDWFGSKFVEGSAKTIINVANIARSHGFKVSREELLSELISRSEKTYQALKEHSALPVTDGHSLFRLYLQHYSLDEQTLVSIWEDVTLFRRLFHEVGGAVCADALPLENFYAYAHQNASIELYQMAPELRFQNDQDLIQFETYLEAVGRGREKETNIALEYESLDLIERRAPELIGKRYVLSVAEIERSALLAKVGMKATWDWELDPLNWDMLKKQFPELGVSEGTPFEVLEKMDSKGRKLVDAFARKQIASMHPEWIEEALDGAPWKEKEFFFTSLSKKSLPGITDTAALVRLLEEQTEISGYSQDEEHYYRISLHICSGKQIASFKYALQEGLLDALSIRLNGEMLALKVAGRQSNLDTAAEQRFASFLAKYRESPPEGALATQWVIEKKEKTLVRSDPSFISIENIFETEIGDFSKIGYDSKEGLYCYRFLGSHVDKSLPMDKMLQAEQILSKEVRCRFFEEILSGLSLFDA